MTFLEKWIWLPAEQYPDNQTTYYSALAGKEPGNYTVAEFRRTYSFGKTVTSAHLRFSGDTLFLLYINDNPVAAGPAAVGGDFIGNEEPRDNYYSYEHTVTPNSDTLDFFARVQMMPVTICDYSKGHGGFMLTAHITFADGTKTVIHTDKSWNVRRNRAYVTPFLYDGRIEPDDYVAAQEITNIWHTQTAPIPVRERKVLKPVNRSRMTLSPYSEEEVVFELGMIYAGYISLASDGEIQAEILCREINEDGSREKVILQKGGSYTGFRLHSAGRICVRAKNDSDQPVNLSLRFIATCYPAEHVSRTITSDEALNKVLDVCRHTLQYCRQTHHLDSPRHCEPLACTGDYYIESLMTAFSFGDMRLAEFDIIRTAELLRRHDGRMFHTTYSLIWVMMLHDVYRFTGHIDLLEDCEDALILLLNRFASYVGENGLIETPPDYMFVDWIYIDGISMHHPPKALGQTCLNLFYYGALDHAAQIYTALSEEAMAAECLRKKDALGKSINELLYNSERGLYFEGLNTPTPEHLLYQYMPQNTDKRYYLKQSNILAAYVGVCGTERARELIRKIMSEECPGEYQPYFAHYLLEAIYRNGLRDEFTLAVLEKWKKPVAECDKGLAEGFVKPEPTYHFDHSHAWGGTPLYALPLALLGLEIEKPGLREVKLNPSLLGLKEATVALPTPWGEIVCRLKEGEAPVVTHPDEVTVVVSCVKEPLI